MKRYSLEYSGSPHMETREMVASESGEWVAHEDAEAEVVSLESAVALLVQQRDEAYSDVALYRRCGFVIGERNGERFVRGHGKEWHAE